MSVTKEQMQMLGINPTPSDAEMTFINENGLNSDVAWHWLTGDINDVTAKSMGYGEMIRCPYCDSPAISFYEDHYECLDCRNLGYPTHFMPEKENKSVRLYPH